MWWQLLLHQHSTTDVVRKGRQSKQGEDLYIIVVNYFNVCGCYFATTAPATKKTTIGNSQCMYNQIVHELTITNCKLINQGRWNEGVVYVLCQLWFIPNLHRQ
jgi:hypothetical protein